MSEKQKLLVLVGPSAVGKTTVAASILERDDRFYLLRSATTRSARGDGHDDEYIYLSRDEFRFLLAEDGMLEYMEYAGELYGTPRSELKRAEELSKIPLLILDLVGLKTLFRMGISDVRAVYIYDDLTVLSDRLYKRYGDKGEKYLSRKEQNERDYLSLSEYSEYIHAVVKNDASPERSAERIILLFEEERNGEKVRKEIEKIKKSG